MLGSARILPRPVVRLTRTKMMDGNEDVCCGNDSERQVCLRNPGREGQNVTSLNTQPAHCLQQYNCRARVLHLRFLSNRAHLRPSNPYLGSRQYGVQALDFIVHAATEGHAASNKSFASSSGVSTLFWGVGSAYFPSPGTCFVDGRQDSFSWRSKGKIEGKRVEQAGSGKGPRG